MARGSRARRTACSSVAGTWHDADVNLVDSGIFAILQLGLLALVAWALIDAALRPAEAFPAASRLTKPIWLAILAVSAVVAYFSGALGFFGIFAAVAVIIYLGDVRPAVRAISGGGNRGGGRLR